MKLVFSGLKVYTMKIFHLLPPAHFLRQVKTPKTISKIKILYTFFKAWDKIPHQLLKNLVVNMPKRVFDVNRKKLSLPYLSRQCVLEKN